MITTNRFIRFCVLMISAALLSVINPGCATIGNDELTARVQALPEDIRNDVYVYFINSPLDQLHFGRLGDVTNYVRKAGFEHSSYRHWAEGQSLANDLLELRALNPESRIVLVAWSGGSLTVWDATTELNAHNQIVDCIVYLDSNWIKKRVRDRGHPNNVVRVVCIYNQNREPPQGLPSPTVYRVSTKDHLAVPAHPEAVEALINEIIATATQSRF